MSADSSLSSLIAATAQWLTHAYPSAGGALQRGLAEAQARQAVTVAAWLRYPTELDAQLVSLSGPGGSARLDWITGSEAEGSDDPHLHPWRSWVDEVVASWAACLLGTPALVTAALTALPKTERATGEPVDFRRLTHPNENDWQAAALLRHPDLLAPVADLHHEQLRELLQGTASSPS
ncbi:hypothetical protein ABZX75_25580 [Streptomyces sp. NPDC003038]|uniref:hypothetical protein n=1 Tax=unclassified Streptomyces TaxID=2593676 RepID=UPI0033A0F512